MLTYVFLSLFGTLSFANNSATCFSQEFALLDADCVSLTHTSYENFLSHGFSEEDALRGAQGSYIDCVGMGGSPHEGGWPGMREELLR